MKRCLPPALPLPCTAASRHQCAAASAQQLPPDARGACCHGAGGGHTHAGACMHSAGRGIPSHVRVCCCQPAHAGHRAWTVAAGACPATALAPCATLVCRRASAALAVPPLRCMATAAPRPAPPCRPCYCRWWSKVPTLPLRIPLHAHPPLTSWPSRTRGAEAFWSAWWCALPAVARTAPSLLAPPATCVLVCMCASVFIGVQELCMLGRGARYAPPAVACAALDQPTSLAACVCVCCAQELQASKAQLEPRLASYMDAANVRPASFAKYLWF